MKKVNEKNETEKGLILGFSIIGLLIILGILPFFFGFEYGPVKKGPASVLAAIYIQFWGVLFLLSYYFSHKTFFFRGLIWLCENFSRPRGRGMAFFYFFLAFGLGTNALLEGLGILYEGSSQKEPIPYPPGIEPIENWWYQDPSLYIVLILLAGIIYYRFLKNK